MYQDIYQLLTLDIPEARKRPIGFLEIINKQYHENINSTVYAHFINSEEQSVRDLFLNALTELIQKKTGKSFSFGKAYATCEVATKNGRIDIVIQDEWSQQVIIIENKIFHWLHNDLMDYWNHYPISDKLKVGILLTPYPHDIPEPVKNFFINITHADWIAKVKETGLPFGISNKYAVYITDFVSTIESLSQNQKMNDQAKFYFQHAAKIQKVQETVSAAHQFLNEQFQLIADKLGWNVYGNSLDWRNFWDAPNGIDTYLTIITSDLNRGEMKVKLILELNRENRNRFQEIEELLKNHPQFKQMRKGDVTFRYIHLGVREYHITPSDLENLADFVYQKVLEDFADATLKAIKHFYPNTNISKWERTFLKNETSN